MSTTNALLTVLVVAAGTMLTRALPFLLFSGKRETPKYITYLGKVLPCATMGMLVVYCLKAVTPMQFPFGLPELISVSVVALLQWFKKNTLLSISAGTVLYMVLVQTVFAV